MIKKKPTTIKKIPLKHKWLIENFWLLLPTSTSRNSSSSFSLPSTICNSLAVHWCLVQIYLHTWNIVLTSTSVHTRSQKHFYFFDLHSHKFICWLSHVNCRTNCWHKLVLSCYNIVWFFLHLACLKDVINDIGLSIFNICLRSSFNPLTKLKILGSKEFKSCIKDFNSSNFFTYSSTLLSCTSLLNSSTTSSLLPNLLHTALENSFQFTTLSLLHI